MPVPPLAAAAAAAAAPHPHHPHYDAAAWVPARPPPADPRDGPVWVFGYGSLVHTPGFAYSARVEGYVRGWRRVLWQGSTDHRGTPAAPGRTATMAPAAPGARCWGAAYRLAGPPEEQAATLRYIEWREKQYDLCLRLDVWAPPEPGGGGAPVVVVPGAITYVATADAAANPNWLGPAPAAAVAAQVAAAAGPSGPNAEYVFRLADALRAVRGAEDAELFEVEAEVRRLLGLPPGGGGAGGEAGGGDEAAEEPG